MLVLCDAMPLEFCDLRQARRNRDLVLSSQRNCVIASSIVASCRNCIFVFFGDSKDRC
jgi:hypothetical protein